MWLDRLERRLGWLSIPGLASFLAGMTAIVGVLSLINEAFPERLVLIPQLLGREPWRAVTFILVPPPMSPLFLILWIIIFYAFLVRLEAYWGDFKLTVYCLIGVAGLVAAAWITGLALSNQIFEAGLFLAFARVYPEFEILLLFIIPVKMKWLGWAAWVGVALALVFGGPADRIAWILGLVNYALFFGGEHWRDGRLALRRWNYQRRLR